MKYLTTVFGATLAFLSLALVLALGAPAPPAAAAGSYTYNFDTTLSPWLAGGDSCVTGTLKLGGNNLCPGGPADSYSAAIGFLNNACPGPFGVWMLASFPGDPGSYDTVALDWEAINDNNCLGCTPMYYIGTSQPTSTSQFTSVSPPIGSSWQHYTNNSSLLGYNGSTIYVAIGWHQTGDVGNVGTVDVDCVNITITKH